MATKVKLVALIIGAVIFSYLVLTVIMPVFIDVIGTSNATITASSNWTDYPGSQGALLAAPLWIYFIPAVVGIAAIVIVLKSKER